MSNSIVKTDLKDNLKLLGRGKVRDIYEINNDLLLFVATDRISAYDVILNNGIPQKGKILTKLSTFWFNYLSDIVPNHLLDTNKQDQNENLNQYLPKSIIDNPSLKNQLVDRSLIVRKLKLIPLEVIVRGYLTGSAWSEYKKSGTIHGSNAFPSNLQESQQFETPIFTPSTKAEQGEHDENISIDKAIEIIGDKELVLKIQEISIKLYKKANEYANTRGIIIADTKFEFGLDENDNLVLVDEVLTPDSSRFWSLENHKLGATPDSFDKQFVRNWLTSNNLKAVDDVTLPDDVVEKTHEKYAEVYERLTGQKWSAA